MRVNDLNTSQILDLRKEIVLNSLFLKDYENSFGIDAEECFTFFDGYCDYLFEIASEEGLRVNNFFEVIETYDNKENLLRWFYITQE